MEEEEAHIVYPKIQIDDYQNNYFSYNQVSGEELECKGKSNLMTEDYFAKKEDELECKGKSNLLTEDYFAKKEEELECKGKSNLLTEDYFAKKEDTQLRNGENEEPQHTSTGNDMGNVTACVDPQKQGKIFCYDTPLSEETGAWIPVSVPPLPENEHEEWERSLSTDVGFFPDGDIKWDQLNGKNNELTMWDVVTEMLIAAKGKMSAISSGNINGNKISGLSGPLLEQAWKEMAQTLTDASFGNIREILDAEPRIWLADSLASACMLCNVRFHPIMCSRHHCRFCGGIFCNQCSKGKSLMPTKFRVKNPQRVCDVCCVRLESVQPHLIDEVSRAAQLPTHDRTDLSTLRSWLNFPWGQSMEYEIYKATNTVRSYEQVGYLMPEKSIPDTILKQAKGLAILTVAKVGVMVTYNIGTGLVLAKREDGSWSPPSAISTFGIGWGAQAGGELTDFIIVLRTTDAVKTFSGNAHLSVGASLSAAAGNVGRAFEADVCAGAGGYDACYTYSCSKGAFVGCSLEGSLVTTRTQENSRFYGISSISALEILLGSFPQPPAAAKLYGALSNLYQKLQS